MVLLMTFLIPALVQAKEYKTWNCAKERKEFKINDVDFRFRSVTVLEGNKILLYSRNPNEDIEVDCNDFTMEKKSSKNWNFARQKVAPDVWERVFGYTPFTWRSDVVEIRNKTEFPIKTTIDFNDFESTIKINDTSTGKGLVIKCGISDNIAVSLKKDEVVESVYDNNNAPPTRNSGEDEASYQKRIACDKNESYVLDLKQISISEDLKAAATPSSNKGTGQR